jgi:hypothetical protein
MNPITRLASILRIRPPAGGLAVADQSLRFAALAGDSWKFESVQIPPGAMEEGIIRDPALVREAVQTLKRGLRAQGFKRDIEVVLSVGSGAVYTHAFSLPELAGKGLKEAIALNVAAFTPGDTNALYGSAELVSHDERTRKLELLGAFTPKEYVDGITQIVREAGFLVSRVEFKDRSLVRAYDAFGTEARGKNPAIIVDIDDRGIGVAVMRGGMLVFVYHIPWRDVQGKDEGITPENLAHALTMLFQQVTSFYNAHWTGVIDTVLVGNPDMMDAITQAVKELGKYRVLPIAFVEGAYIPNVWLSAIGSALRARVPLSEDEGLSLLGSTAKDEFEKGKIAGFIRFWRITLPLTLALPLVGLGIVQTILKNEATRAERETGSVDMTRQGAIKTLEDKAIQFNGLVATIEQARTSADKKTGSWWAIEDLFATEGISIRDITVHEGGMIALHAVAPSEEQITRIRATMNSAGKYLDIQLPLTDIAPEEGGIRFSMTFTIASSTAE